MLTQSRYMLPDIPFPTHPSTAYSFPPAATATPVGFPPPVLGYKTNAYNGGSNGPGVPRPCCLRARAHNTSMGDTTWAGPAPDHHAGYEQRRSATHWVIAKTPTTKPTWAAASHLTIPTLVRATWQPRQSRSTQPTPQVQWANRAPFEHNRCDVAGQRRRPRRARARMNTICSGATRCGTAPAVVAAA